MNSSEEIRRQLHVLLPRLCDGGLDAEELAQLDELLCGSVDARKLYWQYLDVHACLHRDMDEHRTVGKADVSGDAVPVIDVKLASLSRRIKRYDSIHWQRHKVRFNAMTAVLTALAWIGFSYFVWYSTTPDDFRPNRGDNIEYVADITGQHEPRWAEGMQPISVRTALLAGEQLNLVEGLIEITFDDGAVVVLEGPAEFVVDACGAGTLKAGKVAATVPPAASGFMIDTPSLRIVDLGTEFCVEVGTEGNVFVHVFEGNVSLQASGSRDAIRMQAGEAVTVGPRGNLVSQEPGDFVRFVREIPRTPAPAPLIQPVAVYASSYWSDFVIPDHLIDGSGLSAEHSLATHGTASIDHWHAGAGEGIEGDEPVVDDQFVTFDLGGPFDLTKIYIWQYNQYGSLSARGVDQFDVLVSIDNGTTYTEVITDAHLAEALSVPQFALRFDLIQNNVTNVRIAIDTAHSGSTREYVGLAEVRFEGVAAVEESPDSLETQQADGQEGGPISVDSSGISN